MCYRSQIKEKKTQVKLRIKIYNIHKGYKKTSYGGDHIYDLLSSRFPNLGLCVPPVLHGFMFSLFYHTHFHLGRAVS